MVRYKVFDGVRYSFWKGAERYMKGARCNRREGYVKAVSLANAVWAYFNGPAPKGHVVHHRDGNQSNDLRENLDCVSNREHRKIHSRMQKMAALGQA